MANRSTSIVLLSQCADRALPDDLWCMANHPQLPWLLGPASGRVCMPSVCVIRVIDPYYWSSPENVEILVNAKLITAVNVLLLPAGGAPFITANTFTQLQRGLATSARANPNITIVLLEAGIVDTLYQILTGVLPSSRSESEEQRDAPSGQGLGGGLADMTVMQNLAHRPKDQVKEALSLIAELLPPLPKGK